MRFGRSRHLSRTLFRAALQQTIGKSTCRCADIEADLPTHFDAEVIQRTRQFQSASANIWRSGSTSIAVGSTRSSRTCRDSIVDFDFAGHDCALRLFAAREKALLGQHGIETRSFWHVIILMWESAHSVSATKVLEHRALQWMP